MAEEQENSSSYQAFGNPVRGMSEPIRDPLGTNGEARLPSGLSPPAAKPSEAQRRYLARGLEQPGGKLPLFDDDGRAIDRKTVESCVEHGWAEPWFANPTKPGWMVCKLTAAGYAALAEKAPK
jgi:hypothetical protein